MQEVKKNQETNKEAGQLPKSVIEIPGDKKLHKNLNTTALYNCKVIDTPLSHFFSLGNEKKCHTKK